MTTESIERSGSKIHQDAQDALNMLVAAGYMKSPTSDHAQNAFLQAMGMVDGSQSEVVLPVSLASDGCSSSTSDQSPEWPKDRVAFSPESGHIIVLNLGSTRLHRGWKAEYDSVFDKLPELEVLNLGGSDLPAKDTVSILKRLPKLKTLLVGGNGLGKHGISIVGEWFRLSGSTALEKLDVRYNDLGSDGMEVLCQNLPPSLELLYLEGNEIDDEGAIMLARSLTDPECQLREIFLGANNIGPRGAQALAKALITNRQLTKLYLEGNCIGAEGAMAFAEVLETFEGEPTLRHLFVDNNQIGKEVSKRLAAALNSPTQIGDSLGEE